MLKWKDSWLEAEDSNGVRLKLWLRKDDEYHGYCKLCRCQVKYNTQGAQAFTQHSQKKKNKGISDIRFSTSQVHISGKAESSKSTEMKKLTSKTVILDVTAIFLCQEKRHRVLSLMGLDLSLGRGCVMILHHLRGHSQLCLMTQRQYKAKKWMC